MHEIILSRSIYYDELCSYGFRSNDDSSGLLFLFSRNELLLLIQLMDSHHHLCPNIAHIEQKIWETLLGVFQKVEIFEPVTLKTDIISTRYISHMNIRVSVCMNDDNQTLNRFKLTNPTMYHKLRELYT